MRSNALDERVEIHPAGAPAPLAGTYLPARGTALGNVVLLGGTATPARFYRPFAEHLAGRGLGTLTVDWSGQAASGDPREHPTVTMSDWLVRDAPAVVAWAAAHLDGPLLGLGHSLGGHALALGAGGTDIAAFATVASHAGVTSAIPTWDERLRVGLVLGVAGPVLSRLCGYMPGARLGLGEDMPRDAMLEWSRWTRQPDYFFSDPALGAADRMARVRAKVLAVGVSDDLWATEQQIGRITERLTAAEVERHTVTPADVGATAIGHHGYFRQKVAASAWPLVSDWLAARAGELA